MSYTDDHPGHRIDTEEQARKWLLQLVDELKTARIACDVFMFKVGSMTVRQQQKNYNTFMVKHGAALGSLVALHRCGKLSDFAYEELRQTILETLKPTMVGEIGGAQ